MQNGNILKKVEGMTCYWYDNGINKSIQEHIPDKIIQTDPILIYQDSYYSDYIINFDEKYKKLGGFVKIFYKNYEYYFYPIFYNCISCNYSSNIYSSNEFNNNNIFNLIYKVIKYIKKPILELTQDFILKTLNGYSRNYVNFRIIKKTKDKIYTIGLTKSQKYKIFEENNNEVDNKHFYNYKGYFNNNKQLHREDGPAYIVKDGDKIIEEKYYIHGVEVENVSKYNEYIDKASEIIFELSNGLLAKDYIDKYDPKNYKENLTKEITELIKDKEHFYIKNLFGTHNFNEYNLFNQIENMYNFEFAVYKLLISKILKGNRKDIDETIKKICSGNITRDCINYNRNKKHHYVTTQLQKDLQEFKELISIDDINELWLEINLLENQAIELREKLNVYIDDCSICIDNTNSDDKILTKCGHWFHRKCINKITNNLCPNCKTRLDEKFENKYNINYGDYNENNINNYNNEKENFKTNWRYLGAPFNE